jgi:hypothetical protein
VKITRIDLTHASNFSTESSGSTPDDTVRCVTDHVYLFHGGVTHGAADLDGARPEPVKACGIQVTAG